MTPQNDPKVIVPKVIVRETFQDTYVEKEALFGLIRWWKLIKKDSIGSEIIVYIEPNSTIKKLSIYDIEKQETKHIEL